MVAEGGCITRLWLFWYWNKYWEDPRRKINVYLHKRKEKDVTQETLLRGFIVRAHKLGIIEFQEIKKQDLKRKMSQDWNIFFMKKKN